MTCERRKLLKRWLIGLTITISLGLLAGCLTAGQVRIDPVQAPVLKYGAIPVKAGTIQYPDEYKGRGNGLFYDYQDAIKHVAEHKKLRIQNEELIRLLKELK